MLDIEDEEERDDEPQALPDMGHVYPPAPCSTCGKPATRACMDCGRPVCINSENYMADSTCGAWIMDWWSNYAYSDDEGNEFWCQACLNAEYIERKKARWK